MRTFAQKQNQPQQKSSTNLTRSNTLPTAANHQAQPIPNLRWTFGNQAVQQLMRGKPNGPEVGPDAEVRPINEVRSETPTTTPFADDVNRIPEHAPAPITIQPKLTVNTPGDSYEQEADHVAEQVMRMPGPELQRACACGGGCPKCQNERPSPPHQHLQTKHVGSSEAGQTTAPPIVHEVLGSPGQPLDASTRAFFEPRFGHDFSGVRVRSDAVAEQSAREVNANAYTIGHNIVFDPARFAPETHEGRRLLGHELAHVVQQSKAQGSSTVGMRDTLQQYPVNAPWSPTRPLVTSTAHGGALQREPVTTKRSFIPTKFSEPQVLIKAVVKDSPKEEDLVGACLYLEALPMAQTLALALQIAARKPDAVSALQAKALQGWATTHLRAALAAVKLKSEISRVGFAIEQEANDPNSSVGLLPPQDAKRVLDVLGPAVPELEAMEKTKGFQALRPEERTRLLYLIGGSTSLAAPAAIALRAVLADRRANKEDPATFRKFLTDEKYLSFDIRLPRGKARPRDPFTVGTAVEVPKHAFGGLSSYTEVALRYDVVIDAKDATSKDVKQTIPVFIPKTASIRDKSYGAPTFTEIAEMLAATPDIPRSKIMHVDVHWLPDFSSPARGGAPDPNGGAFMAAGAAGIVNIYPTKGYSHDRAEIAVDLIHETGHTASLAAWGEVSDARWNPWRDAVKSDGMAVSKYGKDSTYEDFAESWALYVPVVGTRRENEVRALIPERCKLMDTLLWQKPEVPQKPLP